MITVIVAFVCLLLGGFLGYLAFMHVVKGKYNDITIQKPKTSAKRKQTQTA